MEVIFGNGFATGKYAMSSSEALGSPSNFAESKLKPEGLNLEPNVGKGDGEEPAKKDGAGGDKKRKRVPCLTEHIMSAMSSAVNNVAEAIRETKVEDCHPDLYEAVMFMPGFSEEALIVAYSHLLDNKAHVTAFVHMKDSHRVLWLRTFLAKH